MTTTEQTITIGSRVETHIAAPHPAAFSGTVLAIGEVNGRVLVESEDGVQRVYTSDSLRVIA